MKEVLKLADEKFVMSFSGGKDSILALNRMLKKGYKPVALLTTISEEHGKSWTHNLEYNMLKQVSSNIGLPLLVAECGVEGYEESFERALIKAKNMGATICAYGDIDIESHRKWDTDRCEAVGMKVDLPLWQESREELVYEFIDSGFCSVVTKVNLKHLGEEFLGKKLTRELVEKIKNAGADPCGEHGEYHTFVVDDSIFKKPVEYEVKGTLIKDGYGYLEIK